MRKQRPRRVARPAVTAPLTRIYFHLDLKLTQVQCVCSSRREGEAPAEPTNSRSDQGSAGASPSQLKEASTWLSKIELQAYGQGSLARQIASQVQWIDPVI